MASTCTLHLPVDSTGGNSDVTPASWVQTPVASQPTYPTKCSLPVKIEPSADIKPLHNCGFPFPFFLYFLLCCRHCHQLEGSLYVGLAVLELAM